MATNASTPQKKKKGPIIPPKRGQIKVQIFENLVGTVASLASKAREALGRNRGEGGSSTCSASPTPPPSTYNSDGNPDIA